MSHATPLRAITLRQLRTVRICDGNGFVSVRDVARRHGVDLETVHRRLRKGWPLLAAVKLHRCAWHKLAETA